ncbi:MAG: sterol desaturase family protein [Acidimicrobiia bacterium]
MTRRLRRSSLRVGSVLLAGFGLAIDRSALGALALLVVAVVPLERRWPRHRQPWRRPGLLLDVGHALAGGLAGVALLLAAGTLALVSGAWVSGWTFRPLVGALPSPVRAVVGFVLFDLVFYWVHRAQHAWSPLWRLHRIHHSSRYLDWVSAFRNHPLDGFVAGPPAVLLIVAGFPAEAAGALLVLQLAVGVLLHANVRWRLRPLWTLVATPEFHHWHHEARPGCGGTNLAAFLPVWDVVFGTYRMPAHERPQRYGVDDPTATTLAGQWLEPFRQRPTSASVPATAPAAGAPCGIAPMGHDR